MDFSIQFDLTDDELNSFQRQPHQGKLHSLEELRKLAGQLLSADHVLHPDDLINFGAVINRAGSAASSASRRVAGKVVEVAKPSTDKIMEKVKPRGSDESGDVTGDASGDVTGDAASDAAADSAVDAAVAAAIGTRLNRPLE